MNCQHLLIIYVWKIPFCKSGQQTHLFLKFCFVFVQECLLNYSISHSPVTLCFYTVMSEIQDTFYEGILIFLVSVKGYTLVSRLCSCFYLQLSWLTGFTVKTLTNLSYVTHRVKTSHFDTSLKVHFIVSLFWQPKFQLLLVLGVRAVTVKITGIWG